MKAKKIPYFDGKILTFNYEYRGFKYSKEFKKMLKEYGLKVTKLIDNYVDNDIYEGKSAFLVVINENEKVVYQMATIIGGEQ